MVLASPVRALLPQNSKEEATMTNITTGAFADSTPPCEGRHIAAALLDLWFDHIKSCAVEAQALDAELLRPICILVNKSKLKGVNDARAETTGDHGHEADR